MVDLITDLANENCPNYAGVQTVRIIEASSVLSVAKPIDTVITGEIRIKTGETFKTWKPNLLTVFSEKRLQDNRQGNYFEPSLSISMSKDRLLLCYNNFIMRNNIYAILITDKNGVTRFCPKMENLATSTTGDTKGKNFYSWVFSYKAQNTAFIFEGTINNS